MQAKAVLRRVVQRNPVPFLRYPEREDRADHLGVYIVETLECGHNLTTHPCIDPLIAKYRRCSTCDQGFHVPSNVVELKIPKKPPQSVRIGAVRKRA